VVRDYEGEVFLNIYGITYNALEMYFSARGENKAKAKLAYNYLYKNGEISDRISAMLNDDFTFGGAEVLDKKETSDTVKLLLGLDDKNAVEAVIMRHDYGSALCVSTQAGCNMGCAFCRSNEGGKVRDLLASEMVLQILKAEEFLGEKVRRVTLMGVGEPLDNFGNVMNFISIIGHPHGLGIAPRHITISTCGVARLDELRGISCNIAISLHAPDDEIRSQIIPANKAYNVGRIMDFTRARRKKTTLEYVLLAGVNDSDECAFKLAELVRGVNCYVNLIPYNETGLGFAKPDAERTRSFYSILIQNGIRATVRREFGGDISAACGQLRATYCTQTTERKQP
jgi:23S rRNA (adenine2503-C2)-methyltransferase